ncbi:hypothetical protein FALBO_15364, partial [Fusarium albosuccineum]
MADPNDPSPFGGRGGLQPASTSFIQTELQDELDDLNYQSPFGPGINDPIQPLTPPSERLPKETFAEDGPTSKAPTTPPRFGLPRYSSLVSQILAKKATGDAGFAEIMRKVDDGTASNQVLETFSHEVNTITYGLIKTCKAVHPENTLFVRGLSVKNCAVEVFHLLSNANPRGLNNSLSLALYALARKKPRVEKLVNKIAAGRCIVADAEILKRVMEGLKNDLDSRQMRPPSVPTAATLANKPLTDSGYGSTTDSVCLSSPAIHGHAKDDDTRTTYSIDANENIPNTRIYVDDVASNIYNKLQRLGSCKDWSILFRSLPELLNAFARHIGNASTSQANQDMMHFIQNQNHNIVNKLEHLISQRRDIKTDSPRDDPDSKSMSLSDKINMWNDKPFMKHSDSQIWENSAVVRDDDPNTNPPFAPSLYNEIVLNSKAYDWLITILKGILSLQCYNSSSKVSEIRDGILEMFPRDHVTMPQTLTHRFVFQIPIGSKVGFSLPELLVLTTSTQGMQLTRVREYVDQTWPVFGRKILGLLEKAIEGPGGALHFCMLPDTTWMAVSCYESFLIVSLRGVTHSVVACSEELSWLAAAFRYAGKCSATFATPSIRKLNSAELAMLPNLEGHQSPLHGRDDPSTKRIIGIKIEVAETSAPSTQWQKSLWHRSFRKEFTPAIIQGYPTARRPDGCPGLELSFNVLLDVVKSWTVTTIYPSLQLRGNDVTLRLVGEVDKVFYWHEAPALSSSVCLTQRFTRTSRADLSLLPTDSELRTGRHIICNCELNAENRNDGDSSVPDRSPSPSTSTSLQTGILSTSSDSVEMHRQDKGNSGFCFFLEIFRQVVQRYVSRTTNDYISDQEEDSGPVTASSSSGVSVELLRDSFQRCLLGVPSSHGAGANHQTSVPSRSGLSTTGVSSASLSRPGACKRQRLDTEESGDDQGGLPPRKRNKPLAPRSLKKPKFLACPFWKLDHGKHWDCFLKKITTISYVKQHLARRHTPAHYCQRCFAIFDDDAVLDDHVIGGSCERNPVVRLEGISQSQSKRLSQKSKGTIEQQ